MSLNTSTGIPSQHRSARRSLRRPCHGYSLLCACFGMAPCPIFPLQTHAKDALIAAGFHQTRRVCSNRPHCQPQRWLYRTIPASNHEYAVTSFPPFRLNFVLHPLSVVADSVVLIPTLFIRLNCVQIHTTRRRRQEISCGPHRSREGDGVRDLKLFFDFF